MSESTMYDLSDLAVESVFVKSMGVMEHLTEGHGMTELAASSAYCTTTSTPSFVDDDDLR